jgi:disulfide bond formation protein DsbB
VPCVMCWYQRIAMYPLVAIIGVSIVRKDRLAWIYSLPLLIFGGAVALYQSLLQWGLIAERLAPCQAGVSCAKVTWELFGFITIPFGSFMAFVGIAACLWLARWATATDK